MPRTTRSCAAVVGMCLAVLCLNAPSTQAVPRAESARNLPDRPASTHSPAPTTSYAGGAHRRGCVTRREFRRAKKGMKRHRVVQRIFKARGQRNPYVPKNRNIWGYSACKCGYFVEVDYTNLRRGKPYRMVRKGWYRQEGGCRARLRGYRGSTNNRELDRREPADVEGNSSANR